MNNHLPQPVKSKNIKEGDLFQRNVRTIEQKETRKARRHAG